MPKHNVFINLPWRELGKNDVLFEVYQDDEKFGTITISKGALEWYPANAKKPRKVSWTQFDKIIQDYFGK